MDLFVLLLYFWVFSAILLPKGVLSLILAEPVFVNGLFQSWTQRKYSYNRVSRPNYGLLYVQKGQIQYRFEGGEIVASAGDIVYLPKNANYEALFNIRRESIRDYLLNFDISGAGTVFCGENPTILWRDRSNTLEVYFAETVAAFDSGEAYLARADFFRCVHFVQKAASKTADSARLLQLKKGAALLLENNGLTVDEISERLSMSRSAFQKNFKKAFGLSPAEYRLAERMSRARSLLAATDMPIKEIAYSLGFYDVAYFYKRFEMLCHMTPKQYREKYSSFA